MLRETWQTANTENAFFSKKIVNFRNLTYSNDSRTCKNSLMIEIHETKHIMTHTTL
jgi:hypothetical protein